MTPEPLVVLVALVPLVGATVIATFGARVPRGVVAGIGTVALLFPFVACVALAVELTDGGPIRAELWTWIAVQGLDVRFALRFDRLTAVMCLVITGVGTLIQLYSIAGRATEPDLPRVLATLSLSCSAMLVLVLADSLPVLFLAGQAVSAAFLRIGEGHPDASGAAEGTASGWSTFIVHRIGDFALLVAMMALFRSTGTLSFTGLEAAASTATPLALESAALLLFLAATGRSTQLPLAVWLPKTTLAPAPVSAWLSAIGVTAGVYLMARTGFLFAAAPVAMRAVALTGALTAVFGASIACAQTDIKKVLTFATVSQAALMFIGVGVGAHGASLVHLITHALVQAGLFLGAGAVVHALGGERDLRRMGGLARSMPWTHGTFVVTAAALSGLPLTAGFVSRELVLWNAWGSSFADARHVQVLGSAGTALWAIGLVAALLTSFATWRMVFLIFWSGTPRSESAAAALEGSPARVAPLAVLAAASALVGLLAWPEFLGGREWLVTQWLSETLGAPPLASSDLRTALAWGLFSASSVASVAGFAFAFALYARHVHPISTRLTTERPTSWLYDRLANEWHLNALYETVLLRPIWVGSKLVLHRVVERVIIDGVVNGVGRVVAGLGFLPQLFHSGNIQRYLAIFAISVAILLYGWLAPHRPVPPPEPPGVESSR